MLGKKFTGNIEEEIVIDKIKSLSLEKKRMILHEVLFDKVLSMENKLKGTIIELYQKDVEKLKKSKFYFIYYEFEELKSFKEFLRIFNIILNFKKGSKFISCNKILEILKKEKCNEIENNL